MKWHVTQKIYPVKKRLKKEKESYFCEETNEYWMLTNKCLKSKMNYTLQNYKKQRILNQDVYISLVLKKMGGKGVNIVQMTTCT